MRQWGRWVVGEAGLAQGPPQHLPRGSPSVTAQTARLVPGRPAAAPARMGQQAGLGTRQNANFPVISAASSTILKG